jgi:hypothetical protein
LSPPPWLLALLVACGPRANAASSPAQAEPAPLVAAAAPAYVWADATGEGRARVVWFRRDLELGAAPSEATLHLFAGSRYLLLVNGSVIASGPARSYPERPEYDSIDLAPHLVAGHNVLAVQVLSFGTSSFQLRRQPGAFIAWGSVHAGEHVEDLATPGAWRCQRDEGYDETAPRMSFAMPPIEVYDARRTGTAFWGSGAAGSSWGTAVPLENQVSWGALAPRSIPLLDTRAVAPRSLHAAFALDDSETLVSFRVPVPDASRVEYQTQHLLFARTQIYSPRAQRVPFGLWWGSYYVNGQGPLDSAPSPGQQNRNVVWVPLRAGYNDFFVRYTSVFGSWDFYLSHPRDRGIELSANGRHDDGVIFESAGPFAPELERALSSLPMPLERDAPSALPAIEWRPIASGERSVNPAVEIAWRKPAEALPLDPSRTRDVVVPAGKDTALVFDLGGTRLGRLRVDYAGPAGSTLDFAWAEELSGGRPAVLQQHGLFTGARHVSAGGAAHFETIKPYGMRYVQVNVSGHTAPLTLRELDLVQEIYPLPARGRFESSDPTLDALWRMGERTLRVCAEDSYIDTPFRERGLYAGDLLVEIAVTLATSGDLRLAQRSLRLLAGMYRDLFVPGAERHPDEIGLLEDFPLLALEAYRWVVDRTLDLTFARELLPLYQHLLDGILARRGPDGSVINGTVFVEWVLPEADRHGVANTAYHALLARALASFAAVARRLGEVELAARYDDTSRDVARLLETRFWDPSAGAFIDGRRAGVASASHLPISSAWPSLWGLTSSAQELRLGPFWQTQLGPDAPRSSSVSPYGGFFLLGALYRHGHAALAEDYMRRYWAPMLSDPDGTLWEHFERHEGTSSHAWSAGPTYYLSTEVLGVGLGYPEATSLGDEVLIAPRAETLTWARGVVPHPRGDIGVDWRIDGELLRVSVDAPPTLRYRVTPRGRLARFRLVQNGTQLAPSPPEPGVSP